MCLPSVKFREIPWQMLLLGSVLPSVAMLLLSFLSVAYSASFREIPCLSVANASAFASACSYFRVSASVFSVKFRVRPWQILLLLSLLPSVANASAYFLDIKT